MKKLKHEIKEYFKAFALIHSKYGLQMCNQMEARYDLAGNVCYRIPKEWLIEEPPFGVHMYIPLNDEMFEERTRFYPDSGAWYPMNKFEDALFGCSDSIVYRNKDGNIQTYEGGAVEFAVIHDVPF